MGIFRSHVISLGTVIMWSVMDPPIDRGLPSRILNFVFSHPTSLHPPRPVLLRGLRFCWVLFLFQGTRVARAQVVRIVFCLLI